MVVDYIIILICYRGFYCWVQGDNGLTHDQRIVINQSFGEFQISQVLLPVIEEFFSYHASRAEKWAT